MTMTDEAARALGDLVAGKPEGTGLRLAVEKGGCAGLQYTMEISERQEGDSVVEHLGARVFIDAPSLDHLGECILDHEDGLTGSGFRIINPRAARSCGCGTSFEPAAAGGAGA